MKNIKEYLGIEDKDIKLYHKNGEQALWYAQLESGWWVEYTYDTNGMVLTSEDSNGYWTKYTRTEDGKELTHEDSWGKRRGFDIGGMTMEEACEALEEVCEELGKTIKITK